NFQCILHFHYVLAQTTDSGSNNFTMAKGVASIFRSIDSTVWDVQKNHHRCICHVIALILGAGLRALQLSKHMVRPEKTDKYFPALDPITEESEGEDDIADSPDEEITEVIDELSEDEDVDPDDAEQATPELGWEWDNEDNEDLEDVTTSGIGFTLKKVFLLSFSLSQISISAKLISFRSTTYVVGSRHRHNSYRGDFSSSSVADDAVHEAI
ncbi:hypothetical protein PSTG_18160, partial [Puccinia striiformis f. sp. tritici PST-78]